MCASERSERAFKIYGFSLVYYYISLCTMLYIQKILWGALFVWAPGQLPTLPSPKSGPGPSYIIEHTMGHSFMKNTQSGQIPQGRDTFMIKWGI